MNMQLRFSQLREATTFNVLQLRIDGYALSHAVLLPNGDALYVPGDSDMRGDEPRYALLAIQGGLLTVDINDLGEEFGYFPSHVEWITSPGSDLREFVHEWEPCWVVSFHERERTQ